MDRGKVIKAYEDFVNGYECFCTSDDYEYEMHKAVLALLKEQEELLRKLQKDKDKLCCEISEWKHKYHDRPLNEQEPLAVCEGKVNKCVCGNEINRYWHPEYCGSCGKKLEWY